MVSISSSGKRGRERRGQLTRDSRKVGRAQPPDASPAPPYTLAQTFSSITFLLPVDWAGAKEAFFLWKWRRARCLPWRVRVSVGEGRVHARTALFGSPFPRSGKGRQAGRPLWPRPSAGRGPPGAGGQESDFPERQGLFITSDRLTGTPKAVPRLPCWGAAGTQWPKMTLRNQDSRGFSPSWKFFLEENRCATSDTISSGFSCSSNQLGYRVSQLTTKGRESRREMCCRPAH